MKRFIFVTMILTASCLAQAKTSPDEAKPFRGTLAPILKVSQLGDGVMATLGGRINGTVFDLLLLGVGGGGLISHSSLQIEGLPEEVSYGYGALGIGVRLFPDSMIHLTNYNNFGLGYLNLKQRGAKGLAYLIEPELNLEVDVISLFRVGAGVSYRLLFSPDVGAPLSALSGVGGQIYVEFGWL